MLTLSGFIFDENSGWTGKSLKLDGINNYVKLDKSFEQLCGNWVDLTLEINITLLDGRTGYVYWNTLGDNRGADFWIKGTNEGFVDGFPYQSIGVPKVGTHFTYTRKKDAEDLYTQHFSYVDGIKNLEIAQTTEATYNGDRYTKQKWSCFGAKFNNVYAVMDFVKCHLNSIKIYSTALTPEEIQQNYEYEQSIDRTTVSTYPLLQEQKSYGIGLSNQLSEEKKSTFRLSVDGTKFVAGLRYCEGLEVEEFTYSEIQVEMEKEEWSKIEEVQYV